MKLLFRAFINALIISSMLLGIIAPVVQATNVYSYSLQITVTENSGVARTNLPIATGINITNLINTGYLNAIGSNNAFVSGSPNGNTVPYMLKNDNLYFYVDTLAAFQTRVYYLLLQNTPNQTQYQIVIGDNGTGNITASNNASLTITNNFSISYSGLINTSVNGSFFNKKAYSFNTSGGNITFSAAANVTVPSNMNNGDLQSTNGTIGVASSFAIPFPGTVQENDMLITAFTFSDTADPNIFHFPAGWTVVQSTSNATQSIYIAYKRAVVSEGNNVTVTSDFGDTIIYVCYRLNGSASNPVAATPNFGGGAGATVPNLTSGFGNVSTVWIAFAEKSGSSGSAGKTIPTNFTTGVNLTFNTNTFMSANNTLTSPNMSAGNFTFASGIGVTWATNILAIQTNLPFFIHQPGTVTLNATGYSTDNHTVTVNATSVLLAMYIDNILASSINFTSENITDNTSGFIFMGDNSSTFANYITMTINGTLELQYQPNAIISGTSLPDISNNGHTGTIAYGTNPSGVIVTIGAITPTTQFSPSATFSTGTNVIQSIKIPANWYGNTTAPTNLPFYQTFNDKSIEMGMSTSTLYVMMLMAIASAVGLGIGLFTGSTLLMIIGMCFAMGTGVGMGMVGGWMVFAFILMAGGIWYLARRG